MKKLTVLWLLVFVLCAISISYTSSWMISPIWVINIVIAYYLIEFRKEASHPLFTFFYTFSVVFCASWFFDSVKAVQFKFLLSVIGAIQVVSFISIYYWLKPKAYKLKYIHTIVMTVPNIVSSCIGGVLFMALFDLGLNTYEFLDYFLEQTATGLSVMCILYGAHHWKKIPFQDYALVLIALIFQYFISTDPIFYACFIFPFLMCYFALKYQLREISLLLGALTLICSMYVSIPLAGEYWTVDQTHLLSRLSSYRLALSCYLIISLFICEIYLKNNRLSLAFERMMFSDELTGLKNRRFVREKVLQNPKFKSGFILLLDIDKFKNVNDVYGHHVGDLAIQHISDILRRCCNVDMRVISRWGGEEFLLIVPTGSEKDCRRLCEGILQMCHKKPFSFDERDMVVTVSIGATAFEYFNKNTYESLIQLADKCLYEAKATGRDRYVFEV